MTKTMKIIVILFWSTLVISGRLPLCMWGGHDWWYKPCITFICKYQLTDSWSSCASSSVTDIVSEQAWVEWNVCVCVCVCVLIPPLTSYLAAEEGSVGSIETKCEKILMEGRQKMFSLCVCQLYDKSCPERKKLPAFAFKIFTVSGARCVCICACTSACMSLILCCITVQYLPVSAYSWYASVNPHLLSCLCFDMPLTCQECGPCLSLVCQL